MQIFKNPHIWQHRIEVNKFKTSKEDNRVRFCGPKKRTRSCVLTGVKMIRALKCLPSVCKKRPPFPSGLTEVIFETFEFSFTAITNLNSQPHRNAKGQTIKNS